MPSDETEQSTMKSFCVNVVSVLLVATFLLNGVESQQCSGGATCMTLESCSGLYNALLQNRTPQLVQVLRRLACGFDRNSKPKVCCPPEYLDSPTRINNNGGQSYDGSPVGESSQNNGFNNQQWSGNPESLLPDYNVCGIQNNDRIVGGTVADLDEHPWTALLRYQKPRGSGFYCGGVLISSRYVLTAAHCVKGQDLPSNWRLAEVRLGEWNTSSEIDCVETDCNRRPVDVPIEQIIPHENYVPTDDNQHNDIALLRLDRNVPYSDFVKPICLPLDNKLRNSNFVGTTMEVAGWGKTENRSESDVKLKVRVPVVSQRDCSAVYGRAGRMIGNNQICAGGQAGKDSCRGDSGGALMSWTETGENWFVAGVVSYGPSPCGTRGWPGVYTRVASYTDWILSKLRP